MPSLVIAGTQNRSNEFVQNTVRLDGLTIPTDTSSTELINACRPQ